MTDLQGAIGSEQLRRLPDIIARRRALANGYARLLAATIPDIQAPSEPNWARTNWQSYCIRLPDRVDQRAVMQHMLDRGVATRRGIMCIHREPAYADLQPRFPLPVSELAQSRTIQLPLFPQLTDAEQAEVIDALDSAVRH